MNLFHELEKRLDEKLRGFFQVDAGAQGGRELIEIQRQILDRVGESIQMLPRSRRVFPFNHIAVRIPVTPPERRAAFEIVFVADGALENNIREFLTREEVEFPSDMVVDVGLFEESGITEPSIVCTNKDRPKSTQPSVVHKEPAIIRFTILATEEIVELRKSRIHLGRGPEVLDDRKRPVRRNDVVIDDATVSRAHAHIEWDGGTGEFRLFDDGSSFGTSILHDGRLLNVPPGGGRGVRIHPGDELYIGQARLRVDA